MTEASGRRELSVETLVERARGGDMAAFEELVIRNADRLFASLRRFGLDDGEAQEVAQETFLRAWRSLPRFEGRSRFSTWLYRIGFNEAQRRLARRPAADALVSTEERPVDELEGLSTQEAASVLEVGEPAFKSRLHRGRMALRALLAP